MISCMSEFYATAIATLNLLQLKGKGFMSGHEDQEDTWNATGHGNVGSECTAVIRTPPGHGVSNESCGTAGA